MHDWQNRARCGEIGAPLDWFFPEGTGGPGGGVDYDRGKSVCRLCPVAEPCLAEADRLTIEFGLWGGKSPHERGVRTWRQRIERKAARTTADTG